MKRLFFMVLAIAAIATACSDDDGSYMSGPATPGGLQQAAADPEAAAMQAVLDATNADLAAAGADYRLGSIEWIDDNGEGVNTVFFRGFGNKQLAHHFVPGDPRRGGGTDITYIVDQTEGAIDLLTTAQTTAAIDRAMATWDNVACSTIPITQLANLPGTDLGVVEFLNGLGGSPLVFADITHAGWLPGGILANNVIASTFTFVFVAPNPSPPPATVFTDIDSNGKLDTAFREILYNNFFTWQINASIDVETIALHEAGHGLSQGHFGQAFVTSGNDPFVHFAPRAVMNAAYSGIQQAIAESDLGGHCSIWAQWPNN